jgi:hypothetical protein
MNYSTLSELARKNARDRQVALAVERELKLTYNLKDYRFIQMQFNTGHKVGKERAACPRELKPWFKQPLGRKRNSS